jgi:hypothetical protein
MSMSMVRQALAACGVLIVTAAAPAVPAYDASLLQARSNFTVNGGGFNLPGDTFFTNGTPAINGGGQVAISLGLLGGADMEGVWLGGSGAGGIVYESPFGGAVSDVSLNDGGLAVFEQTFTTPDGLYFYDDAMADSGMLTDQPIGSTGWGSPTVNAMGDVGYRANFSGDHAFYAYDGVSATLYVAEASLVAQSPYSFLFTPAFNDAGEIASKVRLGLAGQVGNAQPDEIRLFSPGGDSVLIAEDDDGNAGSPYTGFDNSVGVTTNGRVAFIAGLVAGGRGVFLSDGKTTVTIATTNDPEISEIEFFHPAVNSAGLVVFRGKDASGLQAIFVGDGADLDVAVREHDVVATDLGPGRVDQHDGSVVFGGSPSINAGGAVAFQCALTPEDDNQVEWGSGVFIATCAGDLNGDGSVGFVDLTALLGAWGPCPAGDVCFADLDGSGNVGFADLTTLLAAWGGC